MNDDSKCHNVETMSIARGVSIDACAPHSTSDDWTEKPRKRYGALGQTIGQSDNMRRGHRVLRSVVRSYNACDTYDENHDRSIRKGSSTIADCGDHCQDWSQRQAGDGGFEQALTGHDNNTAGRLGRSNKAKQRQRKVRRHVEEASDPEHLKVGELTQGRTEAGIQVELIHQLKQAHESDDQGEIGRIKPDAARLVRTTVSICGLDHTYVTRKDRNN